MGLWQLGPSPRAAAGVRRRRRRAEVGLASSVFPPQQLPPTKSPAVEVFVVGGLGRSPNLFLCFNCCNHSC